MKQKSDCRQHLKVTRVIWSLLEDIAGGLFNTQHINKPSHSLCSIFTTAPMSPRFLTLPLFYRKSQSPSIISHLSPLSGQATLGPFHISDIFVSPPESSKYGEFTAFLSFSQNTSSLITLFVSPKA